MYYNRFCPFYAVYASPGLYQGEKMQEDEFQLMKSYYPETARKIQEIAEAQCDLLDYEGSRLYDEYPDRFMLHQMCRKIRQEMESEVQAQNIPGGFLDDLIQVLLFQEISRRRCRRRRCRGYF